VLSNVGVAVRVHSRTGDDLGIVHLPLPVQIGDLIAFEHSEYRVHDIVETGQVYPIAALVKGKSLRQIARDLDASQTPTAHGGAHWWPSTVRAVLRRTQP